MDLNYYKIKMNGNGEFVATLKNGGDVVLSDYDWDYVYDECAKRELAARGKAPLLRMHILLNKAKTCQGYC